MLKRYFVAMTAALIMVLGVFSPANADNSTWYESHTQTYGTGAVTIEVGYRLQTDGSGLRLEDFRLYSNAAQCDSLKSDGLGKYNPAVLDSGYRDSNIFVDRLDFNGFYGCNIYRDTEYNLTQDGQSAHIVVSVTARYTTGNQKFTFDFNVCSNNNC